MAERTQENFQPKNKQEWRDWLEKHHKSKSAIWLIYQKKQINESRLTWSDAVDEALCFGWIDSTAKAIDDNTYMQFFTKRKPDSGWSRINKEKVERLIQEGLMSQAGFDAIDLAMQNGSWTLLDEIETLTVPADLAIEFNKDPLAGSFFSALSKSDRRILLQWVASAKKPETRNIRISEISRTCSLQLKPKLIQRK